mmetsp:Transcript_9760/g.23394  ORF Transcript_9760/g.23394 Transcript_9760/m.23394 type:complete len:661 (-) Transcript_9760:88-2070(-)
MVAILKVTYQFEVRRCILEKQDVSYDDVMEALAKLYPDLGECTPKYLDDEGDACTLCASSFPDFLQLAQLGGGSESKGQKGRLLLKLQLVDSPSLLPVTRSDLRSMMSETAPSLEGAPSTSYDPLNQSGPSSPRHAEGDWSSSYWGYHPGAHSYWEAPCYSWNAWHHHDLKGKSKGKGKCKGKGKSKDKGKLFQAECPFRASWHDIFSGYACPETAENGPAFNETSHQEQTGQESTQTRLQSILTPEVLAGMVAWKLPELLDMVAGDPEDLGHGFAAALAHPPIQGTLQEAMKKLAPLLGAYGLAEAKAQLELLLQSPNSSGSAPGLFLQSLVRGLNALEVQKQQELLTAFFEQQDQLLAPLEALGPFLLRLLEHDHITCDGCEAAPLMGPRFKSLNHPDYDLCGKCFAKRHEISPEHKDFKCILVNPKGLAGNFWEFFGGGKLRWMCRFLKGKGKGKGCKGKGRCGKRWWEATEDSERPASRPGASEPSPQPGCQYFDIGERQAQPNEMPEPSAPAPELSEAAGPQLAASAPAYVFPVELDDGRRSEISWRKGDDHEKVARDFVTEKGYPADNIPTIISFLKHVEQVAPVVSNRAPEPVSTAPEPMAVDDSKTLLQEQIQQLREMGLGAFFGNEDLEELLKRFEGNVQKVVEHLLAIAQ